jgi:hypothetical protein
MKGKFSCHECSGVSMTVANCPPEGELSWKKPMKKLRAFHGPTVTDRRYKPAH